jgi:hypothetical protein
MRAHLQVDVARVDVVEAVKGAEGAAVWSRCHQVMAQVRQQRPRNHQANRTEEKEQAALEGKEEAEDGEGIEARKDDRPGQAALAKHEATVARKTNAHVS